MVYRSLLGLFLILFLLSPITSLSQASQKIDSLTAILKQYTKKDTTLVDILNQTGFEYWTIEANKSELYGLEALELAKEIQYKTGEAMANRVIGVSHWARGNFFDALQYLFAAQELYQKSNNLLGAANSTMNIGLVYADQQNPEQALKYYITALDFFTTVGHEDRIGTTYTKIGSAYASQKKYDLAYEYFLKALRIHKQISFLFGIQEVSNRLGLLYLEQGKINEAEKSINQSLTIARNRNDHEHIAINLENLSRIHLIRGEILKAEICLKEAYKTATEYGYKKSLLEILFNLKELSSKKKDYRAALIYFEQYEVLKDSIFSQTKARQIAALEKEREVKDREQQLNMRKREIQILRQEAKINQLVLIFLIIVVVLLGLFGYIVYQYQRIKIKKNHELLQSSKRLFESKEKLAQVELENIKLKEKDLKHELELRNKELTSYAVNFIQKNELFEELEQKLQNLKNTVSNPDIAKELNVLLQQVNKKLSIDRDWEDFKLTFENVHQNFFTDLLRLYPDLSPAELKLCALIRLNMGTKEIASLLGISADSTKTARYRLRKKLNLNADQSLTDFIIAFS
jgi:tetratricopeptide (TPR) repeat protein